MIRHTVYFWLEESLTDEQKTTFEGGLRALFDIDVVVNGQFGKPASTPDREGVTQNDYDYALFLTFDSVEDHNAYQVHADHDVFVEKFAPWFKTVHVHDTQLG
jgi:hypothetical protein